MKSSRGKLTTFALPSRWRGDPIRTTIARYGVDSFTLKTAFFKMIKFLLALPLLLLPAIAHATDITGVPKIREGDQVTIGSSRIRLAGIDAPSVDQLCLDTKGERWTCGVAARGELIKHADNKSWSCRRQPRRPPRPQCRALRGRRRGHPEMAGEERLGRCPISRVSHGYDADEKAARDAKAGMWQGAFIAPWDWRIRNKKTAILGATKPPPNSHAILLASASGSVAPPAS